MYFFFLYDSYLYTVVKSPLFSEQTEFFASLIQKLLFPCIHLCGFFCTFNTPLKSGYWNGMSCFCITLVNETFRVIIGSLSFLSYMYVFSDSIRVCLVRAE